MNGEMEWHWQNIHKIWSLILYFVFEIPIAMLYN